MQYWDQHGGLPQQGYPISEQLQETSDTDGKTYTMQYFERAVFEYHPEDQPPNDVLLSLLGVFMYKQKYPNGAPNQVPDTGQGSVLFDQTGHRLGGVFYNYWVQHGALAQQGYPISDPFWEKSDLDGKMYIVQYFERAVFELHSENQPPYNVLLSQLGTFQYRLKYQSPPIQTPASNPTSTPSGFDIAKDRYIEQGNGWTFATHNAAPRRLVAIDKGKIDEAMAHFPQGTRLQIYTARDRVDAQAIAKYYNMDTSVFEPLYVPDPNNVPVAVGAFWEEHDPSTGATSFVHRPVPEIMWFYADQLSKVNPTAARVTVIGRGVNKMLPIHTREEYIAYLSDPANRPYTTMIINNTDLIPNP